MNILVIGSGGREHALVWKIWQSPHVKKIFCAPGNAGIEQHAECVAIKPTDGESLVNFAKTNHIDLTVVGPEQPLVEGIVDRFGKEGLPIFGPSKAAAELEGSKVFAKQFMKKYGIPTAQFETFDRSSYPEAIDIINDMIPPIVVKTDGLAAGKGVLICENRDDALLALSILMEQKVFGSAGDRVVIEEYLRGEELSVFALTDGKDFVLLPPAQDHKRIFDGDKGKNTGGMGAYAPAPIGTQAILDEIRGKIIQPTINGMAHEGRPYKGCLYVGLMLTEDGPKVLEYNCRFGDPEAQVVLPLVDSDIVELFLASVSGTIPAVHFEEKSASAVCVVMASAGYPDTYEVGKTILGLDSQFEEDVVMFHAGTKWQGGSIVTSGGRVLGVTAIGPQSKLEETIDKAYRAVKSITFDGTYYRKDIGHKALRRLETVQSS